MNSNAEAFSNFSCMRQQQRSPPASSRSVPFGSSSSNGGGGGGGGGNNGVSAVSSNQSISLDDDQTTHRSLPKSLHGNYEGDFSMFAARFNAQTAAAAAAAAAGSLVVEQTSDSDINQAMNDEDACAKIGDNELDTLSVDLRIQPSRMQRFWENYKEKLFDETQLQKIDGAIDTMQQNLIFCKIIQALKFLIVMIIYVLRLSLTNAIIQFMKMGWSVSRVRSMFRNSSRRLLWCIILAKYGDIQFFGLIMLLAPLVFFIAILGFFLALYSIIKHGVQSFMGHMNHLDTKVKHYEN